MIFLSLNNGKLNFRPGIELRVVQEAVVTLTRGRMEFSMVIIWNSFWDLKKALPTSLKRLSQVLKNH